MVPSFLQKCCSNGLSGRRAAHVCSILPVAASLTEMQEVSCDILIGEVRAEVPALTSYGKGLSNPCTVAGGATCFLESEVGKGQGEMMCIQARVESSSR